MTPAHVLARGGDRTEIARLLRDAPVRTGYGLAVVAVPEDVVADLPSPSGEPTPLFLATLDDPVLEAAHRHIERLMPDDLKLPEPAVLTQLYRNVRLRAAFLQQHETWTSAQVADFAGSRARNASALAGRWRTQELVFAVSYDGELRYPAFQFDLQTRRPKPVFAPLLRVFRAHDASDWEVALWLTSPSPKLGTQPLSVLDSRGDDVVAAAGAMYEAVP